MSLLNQTVNAFSGGIKGIYSFVNNLSFEHHKLEIFEFLSKEDHSDFNAMDSSRWCPIRRAIYIDSAEIVKKLIQLSNGADLNVSNCDWNTPLTYSIRKDSLKIAEILIDCGADVNHKDNRGYTPLRMAISKDNLEMVSLLSRNGAKLTWLC